MASSFFKADPCVNRVLLLGAGAGTVIRQIDALFSPQEIIAVENNPIHLEIAQKFFGITKQMATLNLAEASRFVRQYQGKKFDLIIDDLFVAAGGVAKRALYCDHHWLKKLTRHLTSNGLLCLNFADWSELSNAPVSEYFMSRERFVSAYALTCPKTENVIAAMLPERSDIESLRAHIKVTPALSGLMKADQFQFKIRLLNKKKRNMCHLEHRA